MSEEQRIARALASGKLTVADMGEDIREVEVRFVDGCTKTYDNTGAGWTDDRLSAATWLASKVDVEGIGVAWKDGTTASYISDYAETYARIIAKL